MWSQRRANSRTIASMGAGSPVSACSAACCAIDPSIATWAEVELYREKGEWGSRLSPGSGLEIITDHDHEKFVSVLTEH